MEAALMQRMEEKCGALVKGGGTLFRWVWDERFDTFLSEVDQNGSAQALEMMEKLFDSFYNHQTLKKAPERVRRLAHLLGGLSKGQHMYVTEFDQDVLLVGLWWPWANDERGSIRIGTVTLKPDDVPQSDLDQAMTRWFNQ